MDEQQFLQWEKASRDTIDFKKIYVDVADDLLAGLALSEIVYWHLPDKQGESKLRVHHEGIDWIAVRRYDWWERTRMSPRQADRALNILEQCGVIVKDVFKFQGDPTVHVAIIWPRFLQRLEEVQANPPENPFSPTGEFDNTQTVVSKVLFGVIPVTESTSETTEKSRAQKGARIEGPIYGQNKGRVPPKQDTIGVTESEGEKKTFKGIAFTDAHVPAICYSVFTVLQNTDSQAPLRLTLKQYELLQQPVAGPTEPYPSPEAEQREFPDAWASFVAGIPEMPAWKKRIAEKGQNVTVGLVIEFLRGYHWQGGWLEVKATPVEVIHPARKSEEDPFSWMRNR